MTSVDAELYLRLFAERELVSGRAMRPWDDALVARARALAAVGVIAPESAQRIVDGYGRAFALRGRGHVRPHRAGAPAPARPDPGRIAFCAATIEQPWGELRLRHVLLGPDGVQIAVTMRPGRSAGGPSTLIVRDDRGTAVTAGFSGGGGNDEWTGHFHTDQQLAPDTAWLEVAGERVELREPLCGVDVSIRSLAGAPPVERYLRHCLEGGADRHGGDDAAEAVEALVGCGVLRADDPLAVGTRAVASALGSGRPGWTPAPMPALPGPWDSLVRRRGFGGGPTGTVRLGAITPVFDGLRATVCGLESSPEGVRTDITLSGALALRVPGRADVRRTPPTFTATDDRGNFYLGGLGEWSGRNGHLDGALVFWPGLDPQAAALGIAITADNARAVIRTPLRWEQAG